MELAAVAFDPDGISVYRASLLQEEGEEASAVAKDSDCYVFAFPAELVRLVEGFDVIHKPDSDDAKIGYAHSLITYSTMPLPSNKTAKTLSRKMRAPILAEGRALVIPLVGDDAG